MSCESPWTGSPCRHGMTSRCHGPNAILSPLIVIAGWLWTSIGVLFLLANETVLSLCNRQILVNVLLNLRVWPTIVNGAWP